MSSGCVLRKVKPSDSGLYWCESRHRQSSSTVNITVTGQAVVLQSPVVPVTEGQVVTLFCQTNMTSDLSAHFYKDGAPLLITPKGHMTIQRVSRSDEGEYRCEFKGVGRSPSSWLKVADDVVPPTLTVSPDSLQFFEYRPLSLSCGHNSSWSGWTVRRFSLRDARTSRCGVDWGKPTSSGCVLDTAKQPDSAIYWCESATRRSNSANITVHGGPVVLQSPVLPVMEGHEVTLRCQTHTPSNLSALFYKDGSFMGTGPAGHMTIPQVSQAHQGVYRCDITGVGQSPPSWMSVSGRPPSPRPTSDQIVLVRYLVVFLPYFVSTGLMVSLYRNTGRGKVVSTATPTSRDREDQHRDQDQDEYDDITTEHHF